MRVNLGCGYFKKEGFVNVDIGAIYCPDICADLDQRHWPFKDCVFAEVEIDHVLEHLTDIKSAIRELNRITQPGGQITIRVPHFSRGFTHWDHRTGFDFTFAIYFDSATNGHFEGINWRHETTRIVWFAQPQVKKQFLSPALFFAGNLVGKVIDFVANKNLFVTSRILCYWVGGFDELEFRFLKAG